MKRRLVFVGLSLVSLNIAAMQRIPLSLASKASVLARAGVGAGLSVGVTAALAAVAAKHGMGMEAAEILANPAVLACLGSSALGGAGFAGLEGYKKMPESSYNRAVKRLSDSDLELLQIAISNDPKKPEKFLSQVDDKYIENTHPRVTAFHGLVNELDATRDAKRVLQGLPANSPFRRRLNVARSEGLEVLTDRQLHIGDAIKAIKNDPKWQDRIGSYQKTKASEKIEEAAERATEAAKNSQSAARDAKISATASTLNTLSNLFRRK